MPLRDFPRSNVIDEFARIATKAIQDRPEVIRQQDDIPLNFEAVYLIELVNQQRYDGAEAAALEMSVNVDFERRQNDFSPGAFIWPHNEYHDDVDHVYHEADHKEQLLIYLEVRLHRLIDEGEFSENAEDDRRAN